MFEPHYLYHPAWAARVLVETRPPEHVDIGSSVAFVSMVSAIVPTKFYDCRPAPIHLDHLECGTADLCNLQFRDGSIRSLSCMHVVEHVGLGRYGDPIDAEGDLKAVTELKRVLAADGDLLFVVPVGSPRICFNAHRVYACAYVLELFRELTLHEFALVTDDWRFIRNASPTEADGQHWGCGCFWFKKPRSYSAGSTRRRSCPTSA